MAGRVAPYIDNTGLVFAYDQSNIIRSYLGKPATNFYTNGDFTGGTGVTQEGGSNATNTIVQLENPGNSPYVLRQNGNYTEYQINLTSQLSSSTTYVMSGWYAESLDYNGNSMMFHSRAFSASGNHVALDVGLYNVVTTKVVGGLTWKYCYATITTPSDYNNDFNWYLGYGQPSHTGYRYYTNLQMEVGSTPSQFVDGTRSVTQGLKDLTGRSTIDLSNVSFDSSAQMTFDGTNDLITLADAAHLRFSGGSFTIEQILAVSSISSKQRTFSKGSSGWSRGWHAAIRPTQWEFELSDGISTPGNSFLINTATTVGTNHVAWVIENAATAKLYVNGVQVGSTQTITESVDFATTTSTVGIGAFESGGEYFNGKIPYTKLYARALSASEIQQNFNAVRGRYGI